MKKRLLQCMCIYLLFSILFFSCRKSNNVSEGIDDINNLVINTENHFTSIVTLSKSINAILMESKPKGVSLPEYKVSVLSGKLPLSKSQQDRILKIMTPLSDFGKTVADRNHYTDESLVSQISMGALNGITFSRLKPDSNDEFASIGKLTYSKGFKAAREEMFASSKIALFSTGGEEEPDDDDVIIEGDLTWGEVAGCAMTALGVDALWSLGRSTGTSWTISALRTTFTNVAKRFLGPIGVGIAVVSFAYCLYEHSGLEVPQDVEDWSGSELAYAPNIPLQFFNPDKVFYNNIKDSIITFLVNVKGLSLYEAELTVLEVHRGGPNYNPFTGVGSEYVELYGAYVDEYFRDVYSNEEEEED